MAKRASRKKTKAAGLRARVTGGLRRAVRLMLRAGLVLVALLVLWVASYRWIDPPTTPYIWSESARLGGVERVWVDIDTMAEVLPRAAVAAEDANFCLHWGFDVDAIREAIEAGANRGASTISQQVVKNAFLWQGRSWPRKALEAGLTPLMELFWPKRRILEVYLNIAEFDEGVFGVEMAARNYFGRGASAVTARQAGLLATVLPNPKERDAAAPTSFLSRRANSVADGAATIRADGRAACFED
ncbi:monofunctional biosynthetic peptidoglycan transglycosylase [Jannaschia sp. M317]|uniref:monofunctional biosynthetic peptidoglycan transglycosylase n=1 Tax=Jannaschia sp. M317 TaxID=2867011 RepID=UPI0021A278E0|nr:monofunctional biosynthetic peptidoglycan transglycosylase [Jannaschia sp. M317]UWQ18282.1 monofunctional biosynthetic peptidoglycan transglycosylase [Jannaschia sp. M317]